jgi:hypothetical protein
MTFFCLFCRSDSLPLEEIKDVYLLDFVGPPGFVEDISTKVERSVSICTQFSYPEHRNCFMLANVVKSPPFSISISPEGGKITI